jgi:hypothetical protein
MYTKHDFGLTRSLALSSSIKMPKAVHQGALAKQFELYLFMHKKNAYTHQAG